MPFFMKNRSEISTVLRKCNVYSYDPTILVNLEPFEVYQLYVYVIAVQDFKSLHYLHSVDPNQVPIDTYVKESPN